MLCRSLRLLLLFTSFFMNKSLRKIIYWGSALSLYALMITVVFCLLFELDMGKLFRSAEKSPVASGAPGGASDAFEKLENSNGFSAVLLPTGPNDSSLPGLPEIWDEFLLAGGVDVERKNANGFDGLQAAKNVEEFSKGAVAELFLSGNPSQAFRRGQFLLLLNGQGNVQVVDCENPREPVVLSFLPYQKIKHMEMQGDIAYLHLERLGAQFDRLVVVDLGSPRKPRELAQVNLPELTTSFLFVDHQLVVFTNVRGYKGNPSIHLYDVTDDSQLIPLGSTKSPFPGNDLLRYGNYLLVPDLRAGLHVYDFSNPLQPFFVSFLAFPDRVLKLIGHGDKAFVKGTQNRFYVIDLHDPLHPTVSTVVEDASHLANFMVFGDYLYCFTGNGYLRVFDVPLSAPLHRGDKRSPTIAGELVSRQNGEGFTLLGNVQAALPDVVTEVLTLPDKSNAIDQLFWQGDLVVLDKSGLVQFFRKGQEGSLEQRDSLKLPSSQRWMAASSDRLYVGGESTISVIAKVDDDHFVLSGQFEFSGAESWDGIVVQQTLCVAAGKTGVLCFSVEHPDRLATSPGWMIPRHLESMLDVRQLATPGGDRFLAAAGAAGLLSGRINAAGHCQFDGFISFPVSIDTLAVVENFCLVSTGSDVSVVDIRDRNSFQNLGKIAFPGVDRFAVAAPDFWAGHVPGVGWSALPVPRLVLPEEIESLDASRSTAPPVPLHDRYRLNLFNDHEVITAPGVRALSPSPGSPMTGAVHDFQ